MLIAYILANQWIFFSMHVNWIGENWYILVLMYISLTAKLRLIFFMHLLTDFLTISSSSLRAHMALSRLDTNSSKYWYLSFFLARHSLALCRLLSSFAFKSILAGFRPRLPGFFTLPPTTFKKWENNFFLLILCLGKWLQLHISKENIYK